MTKLFKNSKSILSFVLAFAVLAVSLFTGVVINTEAANCDDTVNVVYVTVQTSEPDGSYMDGTHGTGTEADPYVISTYGQLRHLVQQSTYATTHGKFFEIDENIDILCLQGEAYIGDINTFMAKSATEVKEYFETNTTNRWIWQSSIHDSAYTDAFSGTFDGNGVKVVGMYNNNGGLFSNINEGAVLKNLTVSNSYISAGWWAGAVAGAAYISSSYPAEKQTEQTCDAVVAFENIVVNNNYILNKGNAQANTGALFGMANKFIAVHMDGILTYGNSIWAETVKDSGNIVSHQFLFGKLSTGHNGDNGITPNGSYSDSVILDCAPFAFEASAQAFKPQYYSNVYTNCEEPSYGPGGWKSSLADFPGIIRINAENIKGSAAMTTMPNLDWVNTWVAVDGKYPELRSNHNITLVDNGDGTHKEACTVCGLSVGDKINHSFVDGVCGCGYEAKCGENIIYWNGGSDSTLADNGETGADWANAIIIDNAEELNYLANNLQNSVSNNIFNTKDKYYKMADGIDYAILQPEGKLDVERLLACSGDEVYTYFNEIGLTNLVNWETSGIEMWFGGHFDGNGVTFAGMYSADNSAGLFATADGGAEFKNLAVVSSYIDGVAGNARTGAIVGGTCGSGFGAGVAGTVTFDTIMVANNYLHCYTNQGNGAIVMGSCNDQDAVSINNAMVYGNASKYSNSGNTGLENVTMHLYGAVRKSMNASLKSTVTNSIILGTRPYYAWYDANMSGVESLENVYTDQPLKPYSEVTYATTDLAAITYDELIGSKAQSVVDALNNANDEDVWYIGNSFDGMPGFKKANNMPGAYQIAYNSAVVLDTYNDYGESTEDFGLYTTSLNFKNNPYLSLTFAFGNLDGVNTKLDRDNITVTIETASQKIVTTPPAYKEGVYISGANGTTTIDGDEVTDANGWTNKKGAGRYHMYKLDDLNVYDLSKPITVTIKYGDKIITSTVSIEGFALELQKAYMVAPCDYYATRLEAVKALLFYTQALSEKYGA